MVFLKGIFSALMRGQRLISPYTINVLVTQTFSNFVCRGLSGWVKSKCGLIVAASGTFTADVRSHPTEEYCKPPEDRVGCAVYEYITINFKGRINNIHK